ncbi:hypothetical protein SDC9_85679 [bioreactor metagenome]|uniref:Uncharacterized protein n=1 Tax=bioreactor metagenome TaxID=1076179 RepID=A0A644ZFG6_9ZZZZ
MESLGEELLDLREPLLGGCLIRRDDDDIVHIPGVELRFQVADAILIELVEVDVGEVLGADVPEGDARFSFWARVNHFAKKPIELEEVLVFLRVLLF